MEAKKKYLNCFDYAINKKFSLTTLQTKLKEYYKKNDQAQKKEHYATDIAVILKEMCEKKRISFDVSDKEEEGSNVILCLGKNDKQISDYNAYEMHFAKKENETWKEVPSAIYTEPQDAQKKPTARATWSVITGSVTTKYEVMLFFEIDTE